MEKVHDVLIIGAGMSGLAASYTLTQKGIAHIIVEGRDRIGGRIFADKFDGDMFQLGANFVHFPHEEGHVICALMKRLGVTYYSANYETQYFWLQGGKILSESQKDKVYHIYDQMVQDIKKTADELQNDVALSQLTTKYLQSRADLSEQQRSTLQWLVQQHGNVQGAQISQLSAKQAEFKSLRNDIIPITGYSKFLRLFVHQFQPTIHFNQRVTKVDYSQQIPTIFTEKTVYKAKKVICSLPLGVLQAKKVEFAPQLPHQYTEAINGIGVAVFNVLLVTFQQPFWGNKQGWLHFVPKTGRSKYPEIFIIPTASKPILRVQISVQASKSLADITDQAVVEDFHLFLKDYVGHKNITIKDYKLTRWHLDEYSLGSYSYTKVGGNLNQIKTFSQPIRDNLWFIGEHTSIENQTMVHGAFQSGVRAANQISSCFQKGSA